ncbi:sucrase/ferredoxin domain-containing protein [Hirsutella rhossiliensis]|uniref:Defect at low temperature protein 1 n=1 Tax=Hirsutella rhossiliensis TaxID=111463 RepID=A0A9P8SFB7_9HYPO|nr:sucrase/ferredoxin domain-containing protein [Hirsutella rhossiliensis]KAH0960738.1 sucrase/ferredoxin domain-containing protein [Hirsutella rhossiliensis]
MHYRRLLFRIVYASIYLLFYFLLLGLLLVTISDTISESLRNEQNYNVWIVTISVVVTVVVVGFVYVFRLYINKTALASIPKAWVPIEKGDVKDAVYKAIAAGLDRSAFIAFEAQPRVEADGRGQLGQLSEAPRSKCDARATKTAAEELAVARPSRHAVWGDIEHHGWASPVSPDMPNLQYGIVLLELPNLVEGKALALAPADPTAPTNPPIMDPEAVDLLQRSPNMSLRGYVDHLADLGVVPAGSTTAEFVSQYEHARFSNRPISNARFRELMHLFAEVLRAMRPMDLVALGGGWATAASSESDIDNDAPMDTDPPSPRSSLSRAGTASTQGSTRRPMRHSSAPGWAAGVPFGEPGGGGSFAQSRRPYPAHQPSSSSLRSRASSSGAGSVIRLATREDPGALPYVLNLSATAGSG